ncbi:heme exporter protein CcmD [Loktanella sp. S4079]|nr:heme exporter protein CcmD [Loktanella sp. S4079]KJZ20363.1 hemagglutination activity protein [Loktanella sp. S4079]
MPDLGKYAIEVLSAYGVSLTLLAAIIFASWRRAKRTKADLERIENNG